MIAQYGEVFFDNAYGLDADAAGTITQADADLSDQAYNDPVNFAMNFIPVAAEGRTQEKKGERMVRALYPNTVRVSLVLASFCSCSPYCL